MHVCFHQIQRCDRPVAKKTRDKTTQPHDQSIFFCLAKARGNLVTNRGVHAQSKASAEANRSHVGTQSRQPKSTPHPFLEDDVACKCTNASGQGGGGRLKSNADRVQWIEKTDAGTAHDSGGRHVEC